MDEIARLQGLPLGEPGSRLDPDVEWDQMMAVRSMDDKRAILRQIDQALARIEDKTFGLCVVDSHPIPPDKLAEMPWVKHCEHCAIRPTAGAPRDAFDVNPRMSAENPQPRTDPNAPDPPA